MVPGRIDEDEDDDSLLVHTRMRMRMEDDRTRDPPPETDGGDRSRPAARAPFRRGLGPTTTAPCWPAGGR
eukprot:3043832-Pyramimonas_sp.AAC.1